MMQRVVAPALFCEVRNADFTLFYKIGPKTGFRKFLADAGAFGVRQKQLYTCAHRLILLLCSSAGHTADVRLLGLSEKIKILCDKFGPLSCV